MPFLRTQYLLNFAVLGSLVPYLAVFLKRERGLNETQVGYVMAAASLAVVCTPVIVTALADLRLDARRIMTVLCALSAGALILFGLTEGFIAAMAAYVAFSFAFTPTAALNDGINFSIQERRRREGLHITPYHRVRVWGTVGYIVPSLLLYVLMQAGLSTGATVWVAIGCCGLGLFNALALPDPHIRDLPDPEAALPDSSRLPTADAARALLRAPLLPFCIAMWLLFLGSAAYYTFYPLYLTDRVGIDAKWIGLIANVGVLIEIPFMLAFGRLRRKLGLANLMAIGAVCIVVRYLILAVWANAYVAIGSQAFHGIAVLVLHVAAPVYLNQRAGNRFRHSIQGLFAMAIYGSGRIVGNALAGHVAQISVSAVFACAAALSAAAAVMFIFVFRDHGQDGNRAAEQ